jgi:hypothetical protein
MKTKKLSKKLSINKKTVANFDLDKIHGGHISHEATCETCYTYCGQYGCEYSWQDGRMTCFGGPC